MWRAADKAPLQSGGSCNLPSRRLLREQTTHKKNGQAVDGLPFFFPQHEGLLSLL